MSEYNLKYLHAQRTDPRFQTVTNQPPELKGEVPEKRYAPDEVDLSGSLDIANAALKLYGGLRAGAGMSEKQKRDDYMKRYKNVVLSDYASQDMKLVLQAQQNNMDPSELALQRNLLKQQYLQVAPEYLTQADFNKEAKANFNLDVGAELYKDELEFAQHKRIKLYDQLQDNAKEYMKENFADSYQSIDPSKYVSMMNQDKKNELNLENLTYQNVIASARPTTEEEATQRSKAIAAAAEPVMERDMYDTLIAATTDIMSDGNVSDLELENYKKAMAETFSNGYGYSFDDAYRYADKITKRWFGRANANFNARKAANLKRQQEKNEFIKAVKEEMATAFAIKVQYGQNLFDEYNPSVPLVYNHLPNSLINQSMNNGMLPMLQSMQTQGILKTNNPDMKDINTEVGSGQYVANLVNYLNDPAVLATLPKEKVEEWQQMSRAIADANAKLFKNMMNMSEADLATYQFSWPQVMSSTSNGVTLPTVEETKAKNIPETKIDNSRLWNWQFDKNLKNGKLSADDRASLQPQYKQNTTALATYALNAIQDVKGIEHLRYDPVEKNYFEVVDSQALPVEGTDVASYLTNVKRLRRWMSQPGLVYEDETGRKIDDRDEIAEELNKAYNIPVMTQEEARKRGEIHLEEVPGGVGTGTRFITTGQEAMDDIREGIDKVLHGEGGKLEGAMQVAGGLGKAVGAVATIPGVATEWALDTSDAVMDAGERIAKENPIEVSPVRNFVNVGKRNAEKVDYVKDNYDAHNPSIPQTELMMEPFTAAGDSSINTISIGEDGYEVIIPTVIDGVQVTEQEAIDHYHKTNKHFGKYTSVDAANTMADALHATQEVTQAALEARKGFYEGYGNIAYPEFNNKEDLRVFKAGKEYVLGANSATETAKDRYKHGTYIYKNTDINKVEKFKESLERQIDKKSNDLLIGGSDVIAETEVETPEEGLVINVQGSGKKPRSLKEEYIPGIL